MTALTPVWVLSCIFSPWKNQSSAWMISKVIFLKLITQQIKANHRILYMRTRFPWRFSPLCSRLCIFSPWKNHSFAWMKSEVFFLKLITLQIKANHRILYMRTRFDMTQRTFCMITFMCIFSTLGKSFICVNEIRGIFSKIWLDL